MNSGKNPWKPDQIDDNYSDKSRIESFEAKIKQVQESVKSKSVLHNRIKTPTKMVQENCFLLPHIPTSLKPSGLTIKADDVDFLVNMLQKR